MTGSVTQCGTEPGNRHREPGPLNDDGGVGGGDAQCGEQNGRNNRLHFYFSLFFPPWDLNRDFFFKGETRDTYHLNFICVSAKHLGHSLSEQRLWNIAALIDCTSIDFSLSIEERFGKNVQSNKW